jgi:formyltetrahydrofolate-dependent phosphoribosylglycinamide formyltransferase
MLEIAVFVSGRGSNLRAIEQSVSSELKNVTIKAVFSDKKDCLGVKFAEEKNIPAYIVSKNGNNDSISFDRLAGFLQELDVDLIVLAGFLKKIPDNVIDLFPNKIINIHPALLPSFGGKGMYGMNVHNAVYNSSAQVSGATVHFVNKIYDDGKIIAQRCVDISDVKSSEDIAEKVLKIEHSLLPFVIGKFAENKVKIDNNRVIVD